MTGIGSKEYPIEITNEEEFIHFSKQCMKESDFLYYVLKKDLDLSEYLWSPIGMEESQLENREWRRGFCGSFDGNMHSIRGIRLDAPKEMGELHCLGLFAMLGSCENSDVPQTKVKNLQVQFDNQSLFLQAEDTYFGGIAGLIYNSHVEHCQVTGNLIFIGEKKGLYAGGIGGILRDSSKWDSKEGAEILACSYRGSMIATIGKKEQSKVYLGGIVGSMQSQGCAIRHCISRTFLHGSFTGELVGSVMGGKIEN